MESIEFLEMADVIEGGVIESNGIGVFRGVWWRRRVVLEDQKRKKVDAWGVVNWGWDGQCGNVVCRVTDGAA